MLTRKEIKNFILDKSGKMKHCVLKKHWYEKNNHTKLYESILSETSFLFETASFRERIYYIQFNLFNPIICPFCDQQIRLQTTGTPKFFKTCLSTTCEKLNRKKYTKQTWNLRTDLEKKKIFNKISSNTKGLKRTKEQKQKLADRMRGTVQSQETIKKRMQTRKMNGKPWHSNNTKIKLSQSNKKTHISKEFREKHKNIYQESHKKLSTIMKDKITKGEFTPPITNSWTRWKAYAKKNGEKKYFRSSWEAVFWLLNDVEYEKIRIPYSHKNEIKNYITDFVSYEEKKIYEIKPNSEKNTLKNKDKFGAAEKWCKENKFDFKIIGDDWFYENINHNILIENKHLLKPMKQFL